MRTISFANFKGGTGKTVSCINMADILARTGRRVLVIDADPQHNTSDFYGADDGVTLTDVLRGEAEPYWPDVVSHTKREQIDILPADMELLALDLAAMRSGGGDALARLRDFLDVIAQDQAYDFCVIDCPPSFTAASVAALSVSDDVIIPTRVDRFSQAGVAELVEQLRQLSAARLTFALSWKILITCTAKTILCREGSALLRKQGWPVFRTEIRSSVKVGESTFARKALNEWDPRCGPAEDYRALVAEYLEGVEK